MERENIVKILQGLALTGLLFYGHQAYQWRVDTVAYYRSHPDTLHSQLETVETILNGTKCVYMSEVSEKLGIDRYRARFIVSNLSQTAEFYYSSGRLCRLIKLPG